MVKNLINFKKILIFFKIKGSVKYEKINISIK